MLENDEAPQCHSGVNLAGLGEFNLPKSEDDKALPHPSQQRQPDDLNDLLADLDASAVGLVLPKSEDDAAPPVPSTQRSSTDEGKTAGGKLFFHCEVSFSSQFYSNEFAFPIFVRSQPAVIPIGNHFGTMNGNPVEPRRRTLPALIPFKKEIGMVDAARIQPPDLIPVRFSPMLNEKLKPAPVHRRRYSLPAPLNVYGRRPSLECNRMIVIKEE